MNNGFSESDNKDHKDTFSSGSDGSWSNRDSSHSTKDNGQDIPGKEPWQENPPVKEPPGQEPPREIPPREDPPLTMPPKEHPSQEEPLIVPQREKPQHTEMKYRSIALQRGKEIEYDRRNYTYNIDRYTDRTEGTGRNPGAGKGTGESQKRPGIDENPPGYTSYTGYEVRDRGERYRYDDGNDLGRGGFESPRYGVDPGGPKFPAPQTKSRGLGGTLAMVILGAVLGTLLTLSALSFWGNRDVLLAGLPQGAGQVVRTNGSSSPLPFLTAPAADIGDTHENRVADKAIPSVVGITSRIQRQMPPSVFGDQSSGIMESMGSGVIVSKDGYIVTNSHVVDNGEAWELKIILSDETVVDGEVLWSDAALDLAIVKAAAGDLTPIEIGTSGSVRVGDKAIAIGNPLGMNLQSTMTSGYISGMDRTIDIENSGSMDGLIQTDAAINEGNSGGALLNAAGQLIGINTAKAGGSAIGIGFAIPVDTATPIIRKVMAEGSFESVYMGLTGMNLSRMKAMNNSVTYEGNDGVYITEVMEGTAAAVAGLQRNDIILAIDGQEVTGMTKMKRILLNYELGDTISISYHRNGRDRSTELTFAQDSSTIDQFIPAP